MVKVVGRIDFFINLVGLIAGVYLAVGNLFKASNYPRKTFWVTDQWPWKLLLAAAVFVPIVAFYKYLDALCAKEGRRQVQINHDAAVFCKAVAAKLAEACTTVQLATVEVSILLCGKRGDFKRVGEFFLGAPRPRNSPLIWRKGLGVAGTAWLLAERGQLGAQALNLDLTKLEKSGKPAFNALTRDERAGLEWHQLKETTAQYKGVVAAPIRSSQSQRRGSAEPKVLAILVIDYTGEDLAETGFGCISNAFTGSLPQLMGSIEPGMDRLLSKKHEPAS